MEKTKKQSKREVNRCKNEKKFLGFISELSEYEIEEKNFKYLNARQKINIRHTKCNTVWDVKISKFWKEGSRCPNKECFREKKVSHLRKDKKFFEFLADGKYKLLEKNFKYLNKRQRVKIQHVECGTEWRAIIDNLVRSKTTCPKCKHKSRQQPTQKRLQEIFQLENEYELINPNFEYANVSQKVFVKHVKCGKIFEPTIHNFLDNNSRCPNCCFSYSGKQREIFDFIEGLGLEVIENTRKEIPPKELDIYVLSHKFAVEYNGLYWHTEKRVDKNLHFNKTLICLENGISLMHVFSDEWKEKKEIVKSMICHRLHKCERNIYARNCVVGPIDRKSGRSFFESTHICGDNNAREYFGLTFNNEMVSCLSLKKPIQKKKYENALEIARFSVALNTHIPGAFSKLLKTALKYAKEQGFNCIISYADRRFGEGKTYERNGFKYLGATSDIDYWYTNGQNRFPRFKYRAQNGKSERQITEEIGVYRIYGCGSNIYQLNI